MITYVLIKYDENEIYSLLEKIDPIQIHFRSNYLLYKLLVEETYLEIAYEQVQEKTDNLEPNVAAKFLSYPIPKAIVEEWEKVSKVKN